MRLVTLALVLIATAGKGPVANAGDEALAEESVPSGVWRLETRDRVHGKLTGEPRFVSLQLRVIRNRVSGHPADDEPYRARMAGEVVVGRAIVVTWRQDNSNIEDYSSFCTGKVVEKGKVVGTWHDTEGQAGDFVLTFQKK